MDETELTSDSLMSSGWNVLLAESRICRLLLASVVSIWLSRNQEPLKSSTLYLPLMISSTVNLEPTIHAHIHILVVRIRSFPQYCRLSFSIFRCTQFVQRFLSYICNLKPTIHAHIHILVVWRRFPPQYCRLSFSICRCTQFVQRFLSYICIGIKPNRVPMSVTNF